MMRRGRWLAGANVRRVVQLAFLFVFLWLFVEARLRAGTELNPALKLYFWIDPPRIKEEITPSNTRWMKPIT
ncbi:MAG: hypothetical protein HUU20_18400 [Pirellulales bacterium]|nr:hypothetical protein [Pirellulales bacterium]